MVTPPTGITSPEATGPVELLPPKRKASKEVEQYASPNLQGKRRSVSTMQRTPQAHLTQTKLTGYGVTQTGQARTKVDVPHENTRVANDAPRAEEPSDMDTVTREAVVPVTSGTQPITAEFLLQALRENKEDIVRSLTANMDAISQRVDSNSIKIASYTKAIDENMTSIDRQQSQLEILTSRVSALERGAKGTSTTVATRATLSSAYQTARRSVRLWPIPAVNEDELWERVGVFLHDTMGISEDELGQGDIESIVKVKERIQPKKLKRRSLLSSLTKGREILFLPTHPGWHQQSTLMVNLWPASD